MQFEWDAAKAAANRRKHGVSFEEARDVFDDPRSIEMYDIEHSTDSEDRYRAIGTSGKGRLLVVAFTRRNGRIRIISAREATAGETEDFAADQG